MESVTHTNLKVIETAVGQFLQGQKRHHDPVWSLVSAVLNGMPLHGERAEIIGSTLAWFALDTVTLSEDGQPPTVSLRIDSISQYLVFARIYACREVLGDLTWGFTHHMAKVMATLNKMAEVEMMLDIENYKPTQSRAFLTAQLPTPSRSAGLAIQAALTRISTPSTL